MGSCYNLDILLQSKYMQYLGFVFDFVLDFVICFVATYIHCVPSERCEFGTLTYRCD